MEHVLPAKDGGYQVMKVEEAKSHWDLETDDELTGPWVLGIWDCQGGDGLVLEGELDDIAEYVRMLNDHVVERIAIEARRADQREKAEQ